MDRYRSKRWSEQSSHSLPSDQLMLALAGPLLVVFRKEVLFQDSEYQALWAVSSECGQTELSERVRLTIHPREPLFKYL